LEAIFYGVDVGMNRQRAKANSRAIFVYKTDAELDTMSAEDVLEYAKFFVMVGRRSFRMMTRTTDWYVF
jgi:hypothetical protein